MLLQHPKRTAASERRNTTPSFTNSSRSGVSDSLFWFRAGRTWRDRARIGLYWISPYLLGYQARKPKRVGTTYLGDKDLFLRPASNDVRVLRNVFERGDNQLPRLRTGSVETILDLGAYSGLTTLDFASRYPEAEILAVEPDAENFNCLRKNVAAAPGKDRITTLNACISDRPGHEHMLTTGPHWERSITRESGTRVPAITVGDAISALGRDTIDLMKMDIEGAERLALRTADDWLGRVKWLLLEVHGEHMTLEEVASTLARFDRTIILERSDKPGCWVELDDLSIEVFENKTRRIDLLVPPPGSRPASHYPSGRIRPVAGRHGMKSRSQSAANSLRVSRL